MLAPVRTAVLSGAGRYADHALALDFRGGIYRSGGVVATDPARLPGYSFAQAGEEWDADANGIWRRFAADVPRIVPGIGYWARGAITNLAPWSLTTANWGATARAARVSGQASPVGAGDACLVTCDGIMGQHYDYSANAAFTSGVTYTSARLVKPVGATTRVQLFFPSVSGVFSNDAYANFLLVGAGAVTATGAAASGAFIRALANGWYLVGVSATASATVSGVPANGLAAIDSGTAARVPSVASADAWLTTAAAIHAGVLVPPIIATGAASASVAGADMRMSRPIPDGADWTIYAVVNLQSARGDNEVALTISDGSWNNYLFLGRNSGGLPNGGATSGGANQNIPSLNSATLQNGAGRMVVAMRRRAGAYALAARDSGGAVQIGAEAAGAMPTGLNRIEIGNRFGNMPVNSPVERVGWMPRALSDTELLNFMGAL